MIKRIICMFLVLCLILPSVIAEEEKKGIWGSISGWVSQAYEDTADWTSQAWDDATDWTSAAWDDATEWTSTAWGDATAWVSQAWDDTSSWTIHAWNDASVWTVIAWDDVSDWSINAWGDVTEWTEQAWDNVSLWTIHAWMDSSEWVSQAWADSSIWVDTNWNGFIIWINNILLGRPFAWIENVVLDNGILAYDEYAELRSFIAGKPDTEQIKARFYDALYELSFLDGDEEILWDTLVKWSEAHDLPIENTSMVLLPFLSRLVLEGESVIDKNKEFSGPVVAQYLLTILESMDLESASDLDMQLKLLNASLQSLTRPVIIGDIGQNTLVTEDQYYIENFSFQDGKYQIVMIVSMKDESSEFPMLRGHALNETVQKYFNDAELEDTQELPTDSESKAIGIPFSYSSNDSIVTGEAVAIWTDRNCFIFFLVTDQEWQKNEFDEWFSSLSITRSNSISLAVDMESDGDFYGVNQSAQKYTINRIFDEEKFTVPSGGHGWAAERGNNLIDNLKGFIKGQHSIVVGDNNVENGPDRIIQYSDGTQTLLQTKYYKCAAQSIGACFENGEFKYYDVDGKPMTVEVPSDQYEAAVQYMKNRIANGQVKGVTDPEKAPELVRKGNLTYQQAKHIAKAGTVESIKYDSIHACVTSVSAMGISAAVNFAINLWNGESFETALNESIIAGLSTGGTTFIISVLSSQLAKSGLNAALVPASESITRALGPKASAVIVNAFRPAGSQIYGAAAMKSAAKLLRGNMIVATVTFVVMSADDVADIISGKISWTQLAKNVSTTAVGIAGGSLGYIGGAAIGTAILPGAGTVVGIIISVAAGYGASEGSKALADLIAEDDADVMIRILETQFSEIASEYFLSEDEVNQSVDNLQQLITADMLKKMYQYRDHEAFARQLIETAIDPVVATRSYVELPSEEEYSEYLVDVLEAIYEDISEEAIAE